MGEEEDGDDVGEEEEEEEEPNDERLGRSDDNKDRDGAGRNKDVPSTFCCARSSGASRAASRARREDGG